MKKLKLIILIILLFSVTAVQAEQATISPTNPNIRYTGRWDHSTETKPWAYWIGSSIIANFTGTSISAILSSSSTDYVRVIIHEENAVVDSKKISVSSTEQTYVLATGLNPEKSYTIEIVKETDVGRLTFHEFSLDEFSSLESLPTRPSRRISFYGDSNLAGYSLESEQNESDRSLRGSYYGYAGITSRMFDAVYENISRSGATLRSLNNAFDRIDYMSRTPTWDFNNFQPHVVVVNLGANDVGRPKARIKSYYHAFLDDLRFVYPNAHIMLFNAWGWDYDEPANYIHEVIEERLDEYNETNMSSAVFPWLFEQWHGCEYDHAGMAQVLAAHLQNVMTNWTPEPIDIMSGLDAGGGVANGSFEETAPFGGYGWRYYTDDEVSRVYDPILAHSGEYFLNLANGAQSHQPVPAKNGDTVYVTVWLAGVGEVDLTIDFRDQEMWTTPIETTTETIELTDVWQRKEISAVAPISSTNPVYHTRLTFTAAGNAIVSIDDVKMTVTPPPCIPITEICDDGIDNDCDGDADCSDRDCFSQPACSTVTCSSITEKKTCNIESGCRWDNRKSICLER